MEIAFLKYAVITNGNVSHSQLVNLSDEFDTLIPIRSGFGDSGFNQQTNFLDAKVAIQANNGETFILLMPILYTAFILCITGVVVLVSNILMRYLNTGGNSLCCGISGKLEENLIIFFCSGF